MRIPAIRGVIDRRILANYRVDPAVMARCLPSPFRPKLVNGSAIAGICLIRLKQIRPRFLPLPIGITSENAAHRIAVEWTENGTVREGVYIPRRDTDSRLNTWVGGRIFPGVHHHADFTIDESGDRVSVALRSDDGSTQVSVAGTVTADIPADSVFPSLAAASEFFAGGSLGYSVTREHGCFDGLELRCTTWQVEPLAVEQVTSSYFSDEARFPPGSVHFDCALLMRGIRHEWHGRGSLRSGDFPE